jgi:hypothetical protein
MKFSRCQYGTKCPLFAVTGDLNPSFLESGVLLDEDVERSINKGV